MTVQVLYVGSSDVREFGGSDFARWGVESEPLTFVKGTPVIVSEEVADVLLGDRTMRSDFQEYVAPKYVRPKKPPSPPAEVIETDDEDLLGPEEGEDESPDASSDAGNVKKKPQGKAQSGR